MTQLLVYRFEGDAAYDGRVLGALQRMEAAGGLRVTDALFVVREPASGELVAIQPYRGGGGMVASVLTARLDPAERRRRTERALSGELGDLIRRVGGELEPAHAWVALLVEADAVDALDEALAALGATALVRGQVEAHRLVEVARATPHLVH